MTTEIVMEPVKWKWAPRGNALVKGVYPLDALRSGVHKYIVIDDQMRALQCAHWMWSLGDSINKANITSLLNRIAIVTAESVGIANLGLVQYALSAMLSEQTTQDDVSNIITALCSSRKTRTAMYAWYAYGTTEGRHAAVAAGVDINLQYDDELSTYVYNNYNCGFFCPTDLQEWRWYLLSFYYSLYQKDMRAISWASLFLECAREHDCKPCKTDRRRKFINKEGMTSDCRVLLWNILSKLMDPHLHDVLCEWYFRVSDNSCFLTTAILSVIYQPVWTKIDKIPETTVDWKNGPELQLTKYVYDVHTALGRKKGRTLKDYYQGCARVSNNAEEYHIQKLQDIFTSRV